MVRQRVTFRRRANTQSASGQLSTVWEDLYDVGALITKQAHSETSANPREVAYSAYNLEVPYSLMALGLTTGDAVAFNNTQYEIEQVDVTADWRRSVKIAVSQRNLERPG